MLELEQTCSLTTILGFAVLVLLTYLFVTKWNRKNLPPGPTPLPFLGNVLMLREADTLKLLRELRSQYGDLFSLKLGWHDGVVVSGYDNLKELFTKRGDEVSNRPETFIFKDIALGKGIISSSGSLWKTHRTFALTTLRNFGFGKKTIESRIMEELEVFLQEIESKNEQPFFIDNLVQTSVSNIICSIAFGQRFEYTDKRFTRLLRLLNESVRLLGPSSIVVVLPFLRYIPGDPFSGNLIMKTAHTILEFLQELIKEHNETYDETSEHARDYIDAFLKEKKSNATFTDLQLSRSVLDLFVAGTETTSTAIRWAILYFLHYPDVQQRMRKEIEDTVGTSRTPSLSNRDNLPFCEAVITEVLRCGNVVPLSLQHSCSHDVSFKGFTIPKGAVIIPNLDSVLFDSNIFENAEKFSPERFIDENGKFQGNEKCIPFSLGRRICLGESLARSELFLYITCMLQRFRFIPESDNELPELKAILGLARMPRSFKFCAMKICE